MKDLFENVHMDDILSFLKEIELYQKIMKTQQTNQLKANYCWIELPLFLC